jgi:hypothetical protein
MTGFPGFLIKSYLWLFITIVKLLRSSRLSLSVIFQIEMRWAEEEKNKSRII